MRHIWWALSLVLLAALGGLWNGLRQPARDEKDNQFSAAESHKTWPPGMPPQSSLPSPQFANVPKRVVITLWESELIAANDLEEAHTKVAVGVYPGNTIFSGTRVRLRALDEKGNPTGQLEGPRNPDGSKMLMSDQGSPTIFWATKPGVVTFTADVLDRKNQVLVSSTTQLEAKPVTISIQTGPWQPVAGKSGEWQRELRVMGNAAVPVALRVIAPTKSRADLQASWLDNSRVTARTSRLSNTPNPSDALQFYRSSPSASRQLGGFGVVVAALPDPVGKPNAIGAKSR